MLQILQSYKSGELWLAECPVPACRSGGIIMRNSVSFVSAGTERMLVDFARKNLIGKALAMPDQVKKVIRKMKTEGILSTLEKVQTKLDQPIPLGYSCAGVVEEIGRDVSGIVRGDRVACGGAMYANHAEFNFVPKNLTVKIPDAVSFEDASCATVGSIALQGVRQCELQLGETVCVIGLGLLGILAVQLLKASGTRVIGFDPNPDRCKTAAYMGANLAVHEMLEAAALDFSKGRGVDSVLITAATKSNEPVTVAGEICRPRGKVVVTGMVGMDIPRDMYYKKELDFKLSLSYGPGRYDPEYEEAGHDYPLGYVRWTEQRNIEAFLDCIAAGAVTPSKIITHRFSIDNALDAYDLLLGKKSEPYLGVVITYQGTESQLPPMNRTVTLPVKSGPIASGQIGIGFIGAGNFTKGVLFPQLSKIEGIRLKGLCTATGMNASETGKKEGFTYATTDYRQLLDDKDISVIFITTRHNTHARFIVDAFNAGKHVFVEKPLAINREHLDDIKKSLTGTDRLLMVGFNRRFSPHTGMIADYFNKRTTPLMISYRINAGFIPGNVWIQDPQTGGGRIIGEACHFIDFVSFVVGAMPASVTASSISTGNASIIDEDTCAITIGFHDGSLVNINYIATGTSELAKERCEVFGNESVAILDDFRQTACFGKFGKRRLKGKQDKGFSGELDAFFKAVRNGGPFPIPQESLLATTELTFLIRESIRDKSIKYLQ
ncbi:MAG: bi-domain-containing oxidoreductase [Chitinispirillaceae bacterium]|nr:bi-domain-containing oxidoreductase [Chitinispirillaceae bacterium]